MRMVPPSPWHTGSQAEKRIFDRLRAAFDEGYVAYHSLKPTRHSRKQFAEVDFVICSAEGLYVLEIKGGRISRQDGVWRYQDRNGQSGRLREDPFRQAETALHGLLEDLRAKLPASVFGQLTTGYGVIFPDCEWHGESAEWDPAVVADVRRSRDMEGWLQGLFDYWNARNSANGQLDADAQRLLLEYLRPDVHGREVAEEANEPLTLQVRDARRRIERLTEDQMRLADVAEANSRVLCAGGAGTGKTFLAERLARRWAGAGMQVALVCRSPWLGHFLASRLAVPRLTVTLIDEVRLDCRRAGLERFDALIVDEGQDLFEMSCLETLDSVLDGGLEAGRWCWFHDLNNQFLSNRFESRAKEHLESLHPVRMPLRTNCRNTRVILEWIQNALDADLGTSGAGAGPAVRRQTAADKLESAERIERELFELVDGGGLSPGAVTVLSPFEISESSVAAMSSSAARRIRRLDEYSMRGVRGDRVGFAKIEEFKGLESDAIILVDLPAPAGDSAKSAAHYVAMSRARSVLSLIHRQLS